MAVEQPQRCPWTKTPLIESVALSRAAGCKVLLKLENSQPGGSFKARGIGNYMLTRLQSLPPGSAAPHFYSSSGGNAGLACVNTAALLNLPATVVVPLSTTQLMISLIRASGGSVIQHGATWKDADAYLRNFVLAQDINGLYVPPFDHEDIWEGNKTVISEIISQVDGEGVKENLPDIIVCSVGGGGLFNGIMKGIDAIPNWNPTVLVVETRGADSLAQALAAGELVTLPGITSIATSLGVTRVSSQTFSYASERENVRSVVLSDEEACKGCVALADAENVLVEPACGVSIALVCLDRERFGRLVPGGLNEKTKVLVVVCGGSGVSAEMVAEWRTRFGRLDM